MSEDPHSTGLDALPEPVRLRIVSLTADVLPDLVRLPPSLRRVAAFAPARRSRAGATAIGAALDGDDELRERVGRQVLLRAQRSTDDLVGDTAAEGDPGERAALLWLVRPEGWAAALEEALAALASRPGTPSVDDEARRERLQRKLDETEQAVRELRARHRAQVDELKSENASLRRKLGEARAAERAARAAADDVAQRGEAELADLRATLSTQDKEVRRLRARLAELESEATAERRTARSDRDELTLRARLLLDTVVEAASGLRRELALPAVSGAPADRVERELADHAPASRASGPAGVDSPQGLEQLLAMPRARLLIDGYNVSKTAWPASSLEAQRVRLLGSLASLVARTGAETTVVFDAASATTRPVVNAPRGVKVVFSPEGVIADDVIRDLVRAEPVGRVVVVVSSDQELRRDITAEGARAASAEGLLRLLQG